MADTYNRTHKGKYRMTRLTILLLTATFASAGTISAPALAAGPTNHIGAPVFTADGRLMPPKGYYHWVFLTSDLGMSYNEDGSNSDHPPFSNVFAAPAAYSAFLKTGTWPDHTVLVKEFRGSATKGSINNHGYFQKGPVMSVLVHVKDLKRFKGGWGFYAFSGGPSAKAAKMIPMAASCYSCHKAHGAVDTTFVQFYPSLLPIAKTHSTINPAYLKAEAKDEESAGQSK